MTIARKTPRPGRPGAHPEPPAREQRPRSKPSRGAGGRRQPAARAGGKSREAAAADLSPAALEQVAARFRVLAEPNRLRLLQLLEKGERNVSELVEASGLSQANTSRHLQTLADAGILGRRREGLTVVYFIVDAGIFTLCDFVCTSLRRRNAENTSVLGR